MADEEAVKSTDKSETTPKDDAGDGSDTGKTDKSDESTMDWQKSYKEVQVAFTKSQMELAELKGRQAAIETQTVKAENPREQGESAAEYKERVNAILDEIRNSADPEQKRFELTKGMVLDNSAYLEKKFGEKIAELESKLELVDPDYVANRDEVDRLVKEVPGITRSQAQKIVKLQADKAKEHGGGQPPKRAKVPGSPRGDGTGGDEDTGETVTKLPANMEAKLKSFGLPKDAEKQARQAMLDELNNKVVKHA